MSDYLSRAAERARPADSSAVRPRLLSHYESVPEVPAAVDSGGIEADRSPLPSGAVKTATTVTVLAMRSDPVSHSNPRSGPVDPLPVFPTLSAPVQKQENFSNAPISGDGRFSDSEAPAGKNPTTITPQPILVERVTMLEAPTPATPVSHFPAASEGILLREVVEKSVTLQMPAPSAGKAETSPHEPAPAPLFSPPRAAPLLERSRPPLLHRELSRIPAPAPPSVNITIGRLEIRAATPTAERPRPAPPSRPGPLALDEFLREKSPRARRTN